MIVSVSAKFLQSRNSKAFAQPRQFDQGRILKVVQPLTSPSPQPVAPAKLFRVLALVHLQFSY